MAVEGDPTDEELDSLWAAYLENYYSCEGSGLRLFIYDHNGSENVRDYAQAQRRKIYECRQGIEYVELHAGALCLYLRPGYRCRALHDPDCCSCKR